MSGCFLPPSFFLSVSLVQLVLAHGTHRGAKLEGDGLGKVGVEPVPGGPADELPCSLFYPKIAMRTHNVCVEIILRRKDMLGYAGRK